MKTYLRVLSVLYMIGAILRLADVLDLRLQFSEMNIGRIIMTNEARVLRELRIQSGLSMRKAGALLGCTDSYISHIENGRSDVPAGERLDKFLAVYGGMKQKSFYERVRNYRSRISSTEELLEAVRGLTDDKVKFLFS